MYSNATHLELFQIKVYSKCVFFKSACNKLLFVYIILCFFDTCEVTLCILLLCYCFMIILYSYLSFLCNILNL